MQVLFGLNYSVSAELLESIEPGAWALIRSSSAALIMAILVPMTGRSWPRGWGLWTRIALLSLCGVTINQVLFVEGLSRSFALHSVLIMASIPLQTLVLSRLFRGESLTARKIFSVVVGAVGIMVLLRADEWLAGAGGTLWANRAGNSEVEFHATVLWGDLLMLVNSLSFSIFLVAGESTARQLDPLTLTASTFVCGAIAILPYGIPHLATVSGTNWTPLLGALAAFAVLGATVGTYLLNFYAVRHISASIVGLFIYLQFVVAAGVSVSWRGEPVEARLVIAAALVLVGLTVRAIPARAIATRRCRTPAQ